MPCHKRSKGREWEYIFRTKERFAACAQCTTESLNTMANPTSPGAKALSGGRPVPTGPGQCLRRWVTCEGRGAVIELYNVSVPKRRIKIELKTEARLIWKCIKWILRLLKLLICNFQGATLFGKWGGRFLSLSTGYRCNDDGETWNVLYLSPKSSPAFSARRFPNLLFVRLLLIK